MSKFANALAGFGAHLSGNGQAYERNKLYQQEQEQIAQERQALMQAQQQQALSEQRKMAGIKDAYAASQFIKNGQYDKAQQLWANRNQNITDLGGDNRHTNAILQQMQRGEWDAVGADLQNTVDMAIMQGFIKAPPSMGGSGESPAAVKIWQFRESLSPEQRIEFDGTMRQQYAPQTVGGVPGVMNKQTGQYNPAQTPQGIATLASEVDAAAQVAGGKEAATQASQVEAIAPRAEATAGVDKSQKLATNQKIYDSYEIGMNNLMDALGNTQTGPFVGRLPAVTADQQIASGAIAAITPILKSIFRESGEGVFTDKDQQLLLDMIPKRSDLPEAQQAAFKNIDAIIKSKLGITQPAQPAATSQVIRFDAEGNEIGN